jgi:tetratricopeptide (TPR) repeat protein
MRVTLLLFVFMGVALTAAAQSSPLNRSLQFYKSGDLQHAKEVIDSAMMVAENRQLAATWYLQGFIYKDLFKANPRTLSPYREKAIESFTKLRELDKEQKYAKETVQNLRFLGASYYNEGMGFIEGGKYDDAVRSYEKFEQVAATLKDTDLDRTDNKISFQLALGSAIMRSGKENKQEKPAAVKAVTCFEKVLAIDSLNREGNYNIAVIYYNEAVNRILSLDYDALNFADFSSFEDEVIKHFNKSLPYMKRAYRANPKDPNTLEGLAGIYFGLRDFERSNQYKQQLNLVSKH